MQLKGQLKNESNQLWLAGNEVQSMDVYDAMMREGTTSDIKITRDKEMSAHELNEICAFLVLATFKVLFYSQLKYQQRLQPEKTCQFLPSSMRRAANRMS